MAKKPTPSMLLTIQRATLQRVLDVAAQVSPANGTTPIIGYVLLTATGEKLHAVATDMDAEIQVAVMAEVKTAGACTVPAKLFAQLISRSSAEQVTLSLDDAAGRLSVFIGRARAQLPTLPVEDFPVWTSGDFDNQFDLDGDVMSKLLGRVEHAVSSEDTRYYLQGVFLHAGRGDLDQSLVAVATDGHRLIRAATLLPGGAEGLEGAIIPHPTVKRIRKLFAEGDVEVEVSATMIRISSSGPAGDMVLTSKLIDGTYPEYERIIPSGDGNAIEVGRTETQSALRRSLAFADGATRCVKLVMAPELLTIATSNPETGELVEDVDAGEWSGAQEEIGVNASYLSDAIEALGGVRSRLIVEDPNSPIIIRNPHDPDTLAVLMPVRI
ncbi:MAG: DNA polymerase III subunit beta [Bacteroidota bacterium]